MLTHPSRVKTRTKIGLCSSKSVQYFIEDFYKDMTKGKTGKRQREWGCIHTGTP